MPNQPLYIDNQDILEFNATVTSISQNIVTFSETYFYPRSGGQSSDQGILTLPTGETLGIVEVFYSDDGSEILHKVSEPIMVNFVGHKVSLSIDEELRSNHEKMHTTLHLVTSFIKAPVTGCRIFGNECKIDFNLPELTITKEDINRYIEECVSFDLNVSSRNMSASEYRNSKLYNSVIGCPAESNLRIITIDSIDSQPCCGTHVNSTRNIGKIECFKIKSHGKKNRRFSFRLL